MGCTVPTIYETVIEYVREIFTHPSPSKLQEKFKVTCIFRSTVWGVQSLTSGGNYGAMDLPTGTILKRFQGWLRS